jgi:hypothetical protein
MGVTMSEVTKAPPQADNSLSVEVVVLVAVVDMEQKERECRVLKKKKTPQRI